MKALNVGDKVSNGRFTRTIVSVIDNYQGMTGRIGYRYEDGFAKWPFYGMCSHEHLISWSRK